MHVLCVCVTGGKGVVTVIIIHVEVELLIHILAPLLMGLDEPLDVEAELAILSLLLDGDVEICQQLTDLLKNSALLPSSPPVGGATLAPVRISWFSTASASAASCAPMAVSSAGSASGVPFGSSSFSPGSSSNAPPWT